MTTHITGMAKIDSGLERDTMTDLVVVVLEERKGKEMIAWRACMFDCI